MDQINNMPRPEGFSNKEFFLRHDNLKNVTSEIVYSAFRRYNCLAGCKVCYTAEQFKVHDTGFGRMVPTGFDNRYNDLLFNKVFPFFYTRSTIDDLFWMNQKYKNIYNWYIEHQKEFVFETILWLDSRAIEKSQKKLKAEYDRIKNKSVR